MGRKIAVRWQAGTFNLIADKIAAMVEASATPWDCTVDAEIEVDERGQAKRGWVRLNNEDGGEVFTANVGWPCPGPGCPDE